MQLGRPRHIVVSSLGPELGNILLSVVREISFPIYVLSSVKTECHQSVSRADGEIRDHHGFHEAFWGRYTSI